LRTSEGVVREYAIERNKDELINIEVFPDGVFCSFAKIPYANIPPHTHTHIRVSIYTYMST